MNYVGIDHHRQCSHLTVMDQEGQVLRSGRARLFVEKVTTDFPEQRLPKTLRGLIDN